VGCQTASGVQRIRIPILNGADLDPSPAPGASIPDGKEAPAVPPPVAVDGIDLETALEQAGAENPTIGLAQESVRSSLAERLQARALLLPSLDAGISYNLHRGRLQSAQGPVLDVKRQSLYGGAGAAAVGAGTVGFPGVHLFADLGDAVFEPRVAQERVTETRSDATATQNMILLETTTRYLALVEAEAHVQAIRQSEADFKKAADLTANFAHTGQGRQADADRAAGDSLLLHHAEQQAEEEEVVASAELARLLNRDPSVLLRTPGGLVPMIPLVDPRLDLESLVQIALDNRPETAARSADVALNEERLREERFRPLLPVISVGYSAGRFGGGSDTTDPRFGDFNGRSGFDAFAFWSLENLGVGNWARQRRRRAEVGEAQSERLRTIDAIRREVTDAYADSVARLRDVDTARRRATLAQRAFEADLKRARNLQALPIEVLNSLQLLDAARQDLIHAMIGYDAAQFQLFVALGRPPTLASFTETKCPSGPECGGALNLHK
jgi:outer membrane protein TolC